MKWYYTDGTRNAGPYSERAIRELREAGLIKGDTWVRPEDSETWSAFDKAIGESPTETHTETAAGPPQDPPIPETIAPQQDDLAAMPNALPEDPPIPEVIDPQQAKILRKKARKRRAFLIQTTICLGVIACGVVVFQLTLGRSRNQGRSGTEKLVKVDQPFENSLGMRFAPVPVDESPSGRKVLFSIWETRVRDFAAFVDKARYRYEDSRNPNGNPNDRENWKQPGFSQTDLHPVTCVSWKDALAFCKWLTETERASGKIAAHLEYRLPTDMEWSWAVGIGKEERKFDGETPEERNGKVKGAYPWGSWPPPDRVGNYSDKTALREAKAIFYSFYVDGYDDGFAHTAPVGSFAPNPLGLFDLGGNVGEWCDDLWDGKSDGRTARGGHWSACPDAEERLLSSCRTLSYPVDRFSFYGFRCVLAEVNTGGHSPTSSADLSRDDMRRPDELADKSQNLSDRSRAADESVPPRPDAEPSHDTLARVTGREADVPEPAAVIPQKNVPAPEPAETIAPTPPEPAKPSSENLIAKALEGIGNATIADAKACVAKLETLAKDLPGDTDVTGVKDHLMAVCRAEATVAARVRELQKAESTAREKLRNAQIAERPSRLTGRVDMESARRYRAEAERIQSDAQRNLTEARANLATSLQDAGAFTRRRLGTPIENAWRSIATRNRIDLKK